MVDYKYIIKVDDKVVWEGLDPRKVFDNICKKNPKAQIAIEWVDLTGDVLIASV